MPRVATICVLSVCELAVCGEGNDETFDPMRDPHPKRTEGAPPRRARMQALPDEPHRHDQESLRIT
eukprot:7200810-Pyramimonas_sp.AAC.1